MEGKDVFFLIMYKEVLNSKGFKKKFMFRTNFECLNNMGILEFDMSDRFRSSHVVSYHLTEWMCASWITFELSM